MHLAIINGNFQMVDFLIKNAANLNLNDSEQHSPVHWAVVCAQPDILDHLLANNADSETADIHGAYPVRNKIQYTLTTRINLKSDLQFIDSFSKIFLFFFFRFTTHPKCVAK